MTLARTIRLYKLPAEPTTSGLRPMRNDDVPQVTVLLTDYLRRYSLAPEMDESDVRHWLLPVEDVVNSYVAERDGRVTDLISFYTLPSSVLGNAEYTSLKARGWAWVSGRQLSVCLTSNDVLRRRPICFTRWLPACPLQS